MPPADDATPQPDDAKDAPPVEAAPEAVEAAPEAAAVPPIPPQAEANRDFGPTHQAERFVEVDGEASGGDCEVVVGEFAEAIKGVWAVKGEEQRDVADWSVEEVAVGASKLVVRSVGTQSGPVRLRLRVETG